MLPQVLAVQRPVPGHRVAVAEAQVQAERGESLPPNHPPFGASLFLYVLCLLPFSLSILECALIQNNESWLSQIVIFPFQVRITKQQL